MTPWNAACQAPLSTMSQSLLRFMSIKSVMPSNHLILCRPLLLPSVFPNIRVFSDESALRIRWPKYWSFSFNISPSNEHLGLISFRMDWLDLLAVQGTLKSLLQHHSSKGKLIGMFNICQKTFMKYNKYKVSQCQHVILRIWATPFRCVGHPFPTRWGLDRDCGKPWGFASLCIF